MAGPMVSQALAQHDYDSFSRLNAMLGYHVTTHTTVMAASANLIQRIMHWDTEKPQTDDRPTQEISLQASQLAQQARMLKDELQNYLYPQGADDQASRALNEARWQPYDTSAWDAYFDGFVTISRPLLHTLSPMVQWAAAISADIHDESVPMYARTVTPVVQRLTESYAKMETLQRPQQIETIIAEDSQ